MAKIKDPAVLVEVEKKPAYKAKVAFSRPVFKQNVVLHSLHAQRIATYFFSRVSNAFFSIDVILRIIGKKEEIDQVEHIIADLLSAATKDLNTARNKSSFFIG